METISSSVFPRSYLESLLKNVFFFDRSAMKML